MREPVEIKGLLTVKIELNAGVDIFEAAEIAHELELLIRRPVYFEHGEKEYTTALNTIEEPFRRHGQHPKA